MINSIKKFALSLAVLTLLAVSLSADDFLPGKIYIKFAPGYEPVDRTDNLSGILSLDSILLENGVISCVRPFQRLIHYDYRGLSRLYIFQVDENADIQSMAEEISLIPGVEYAEPIYIRGIDAIKENPQIQSGGLDEIPDDPFINIQWHLPSVNAFSAWDVIKGNPDVVIAIVDNGVDWDHPDLAANIWINPNEIPNNGVDDDENGFIDDIRGWDFVTNDNNPSSDSDTLYSSTFHGTHVSGISAAVTNNGQGIAGIAPECRIMAVKSGIGTSVPYGAMGITYAADNGAKVINCSWGGLGYSQLEADAIAFACSTGALVVAAAGNDSSQFMHYPSANEGVLAVASIDPDNSKSSFSNYHTWVDVSAPGKDIFATYTTAGGPPTYCPCNGTSMSTPIVSGVAALIYSSDPEGWNYQQVTIKIKNSCDNIDDANPEYIGLLGAGKVNAYRAVGELLPGLKLDSYAIYDSSGGDGDNIPEPGETFDLVVTIGNIFQDAEGVQGVLSTTNQLVTIIQNSSYLGDIPAGASVDNADNPFVVQLGAVSEGEVLDFNLELTTELGYQFSLDLMIVAVPPYANHNAGNIVCTVSNFGAVGYKDYPYEPTANQVGEGFRFPAAGANTLYHGSMALTLTPNRVVSSIFRENSFPWEFEWTSDDPILMFQPGDIANQESYALYRDHEVLFWGISSIYVEQTTYAWEDEPYDDFVIMEFKYTNQSDTLLNQSYAGMFMDWDINDWNINSVGYNSTFGVGYMFAYGSNYYGVAPLSHPMCVHRAIDNTIYTYGSNGLSDYNLYRFMNGELGSSIASGGEYSHMTSIGPFELHPDSTITTTFALIAGYNLEDLLNNAGYAHQLYDSVFLADYYLSSDGFEITLSSPNPNPSNQSMNFTITVNAPAEVELTVYNILGREVEAIHRGYLNTGAHNFTWRADNTPSGIYFLRLSTPGFQQVEKIALIK